MRHIRANRLLHVLACAPVIALLAVTSALSVHAQPNDARPPAFVVAVDAGHGGAPDNASPNQPFDPGVIGPAGSLEKDLTLDVARRVQRLLTIDRVRVVMTRMDDRFVDIGPRMDTAVAARASLFVSIHFNSYPDTAMGGALVLYPDDASLPFAQVMSEAIGRTLPATGIANAGVQAKADLWVHAAMPAVTVEGAYLSNPREEQLLRSSTTRDALAAAIVSGLERQAPAIVLRRAAIVAWEEAHGIHQTPLPSVPALPTGAHAASHGGGSKPAGPPGGTDDHGVRNGMLVLVGMAMTWQRRRAWHCLVAGSRMLWQRVLGRAGSARLGTHRRHLKVNRRQAVLQRSRRASMSRRSVYDEFSI